MDEQDVILVNEHDEAIGVMDKLEVHKTGLLHRAFSIFIFDSKGRMLLQQRSEKKYHGALLWTNACCSHPHPGEDVTAAAQRRLKEEMGFETSLKKVFVFTYHAHVENNLIEHEFDHVFTGEYENEIHPNKNEVADYEYKDLEEVRSLLQQHPQQFTSWFKIALPEIEKWWVEKYAMSNGQ